MRNLCLYSLQYKLIYGLISCWENVDLFGSVESAVQRERDNVGNNFCIMELVPLGNAEVMWSYSYVSDSCSGFGFLDRHCVRSR